MSFNAGVEKLREWKHSPLLFVKECIKASPTTQQAQFLAAFGKDGAKRYTTRSGHGIGKSSMASWLGWWFLVTRPYAKVVVTGPTWRQLSDILWSEFAKWGRKSEVLSNEFVIQKDKIFKKEFPKEWWCRAVSPSVKASKEEQAETLAGFHGDHLLIICEESSGIPDPVFVPLEGAMTQDDNLCLLIGNMTKNNGYFYDSHFHPSISRKWKKFHFDSRDSEIVSKEMVDYFREKYGEDSNIFRIRVAGEPPMDDDTVFIPLSMSMQCVGNDFEVDPEWPLYLSVDVARYGDDNSIIMPSRGMKIYPWEDYKGMNTVLLSQHVVRTFSELRAAGVGIDSIGIGGGVVDWLSHDPKGLGLKAVYPVRVTDEASDKRAYHRLRDELWGKVRENCLNCSYSFPDQKVRRGGIDLNIGHELANELSSVCYKFDNKGAIQIESKRDMKLRGVASPNIADALCISEYFRSVAFALWGRKDKERVKKIIHPWERQDQHTLGKDAWMVA